VHIDQIVAAVTYYLCGPFPSHGLADKGVLWCLGTRCGFACGSNDCAQNRANQLYPLHGLHLPNTLANNKFDAREHVACVAWHYTGCDNHPYENLR
jgi:hypothetical protein